MPESLRSPISSGHCKAFPCQISFFQSNLLALGRPFSGTHKKLESDTPLDSLGGKPLRKSHTLHTLIQPQLFGHLHGKISGQKSGQSNGKSICPWRDGKQDVGCGEKDEAPASFIPQRVCRSQELAEGLAFKNLSTLWWLPQSVDGSQE